MRDITSVIILSELCTNRQTCYITMNVLGPVDTMHSYITGVVYTYSKSNTPLSNVRARSSIIGGVGYKTAGVKSYLD